MEISELTPGDPIEARCTKCRKNTNHIVVAMKDDVPAKVKKRRLNEIIQLQQKHSHFITQQHLGKYEEVLI